MITECTEKSKLFSVTSVLSLCALCSYLAEKSKLPFAGIFFAPIAILFVANSIPIQIAYGSQPSKLAIQLSPKPEATHEAVETMMASKPMRCVSLAF